MIHRSELVSGPASRIHIGHGNSHAGACSGSADGLVSRKSCGAVHGIDCKYIRAAVPRQGCWLGSWRVDP